MSLKGKAGFNIGEGSGKVRKPITGNYNLNRRSMEFFKKANYILYFFIAAYLILYQLSTFFIPFTFGIFFSMLIVPVSNFLETYKFSTLLSSLTATFIFFVSLGCLSYIFIFQFSQLAEQLPEIRDEIQSAIERIQLFIAAETGLSFERQQDMAERRTDTLWELVEPRITAFLSGIMDFSIGFLLTFVYVFLLLLNRHKFIDFIISMYSTGRKEENVRDALNKISRVVHQYLWGRIQVMTTLAVMYYITFLIFGLPFALLVTLFGALITVIPYIGPLVSGVVPITVAVIYFGDPYYILMFSLIIMVIQLIESYVLEPLIIGKEMKINALAVIVAIILGGIIWGIAGMILFVPILATIKIIANHSEGFKPVGYLLGK
ncbi:MAG: AI-2E family transporter [Balneolales bacterium]